ncbi:MAG TPA: ATP-binding protein [bacterium]|nr:ATP-binding protein [bacterium]
MKVKNNSIDLFNKFHDISFRLLGLADKGTLISEYLQEISKIILDFSKARQLNFIVNDIRNYYRLSSDADGEWVVTAAIQFKEIPDFITRNSTETTIEHLERAVYFKYLKSSELMTVSGGLFIPDTSSQFELSAGYGTIRNKFNVRVVTDFKSILILPIRIGSETIGILSLKWAEKKDLTVEEIGLYQYIFDILGFARSHRQAKFHLGERIKELTTIFQITRLGAEKNNSIDDIMEGAVEIIPPGFLVPEFACCRIVYMNRTFKSRNFASSKHTLVEEIFVNGEKNGFVEVGYTKEKSSLDKGPFLKEERPMLKTIARELGLIAERKHFEDEKEKLQQQLLHADRLVTVGQLTAGVAHELNEPLGGILGFAQLIKKYGEINDTVEKDVDKIIKAALHAREIIRKLMLFSRQMPPDKVLFNINERIDDGLYLLENRIKKSSIILKKELQPDLPLIKIDPSQFHQVLVNLVVNAIQAMPEGGTLTIKTENLINNISLTVRDTGIGMTDEQKGKIFIPFYTTKGINEGTGLGLPVVLGIVQSHGGSISVESKPGKGSAFTVKFPVTNETSGGK